MENDFFKVTIWKVSLRKSVHKGRVNQKTELSEPEKDGVAPCIIFLFMVVINIYQSQLGGKCSIWYTCPRLLCITEGI